MLNLFDNLSSMAINLRKGADSANEILAHFAELPDEVIDILEFMTPRNIGGRLLVNVEMAPKLMEALDFLANHTYTLGNGVIAALKAERDGEIFYGVTNTAYNHIVMTMNYAEGPGDWFLNYFGLYPEDMEYSFLDFVNVTAESVQISDLIDISINLCLSNNLDPSTLSANASSILNNATQSVYDAYSLIQQSITGASNYNIAGNLTAAIKQIYDGWISAEPNPDDNKITFNTTNFTVNTSLMLPLQALIQSASGVISFALSIINPVIGAIVYGATTAITSIVDHIEENTSQFITWTKIEERDNDCLAQPFCQHTVNATQLPSTISNVLDVNGYAKFVTGLYTGYFWYADDSRTRISFELYANARLWHSYSQTEGVEEGNLLDYHVGRVSIQPTSGDWWDNYYSIDVTSSTNMQALLENTQYQYGAGTITEGSDYESQCDATFPVAGTIALIAYLILCSVKTYMPGDYVLPPLVWPADKPGTYTKAISNLRAFVHVFSREKDAIESNYSLSQSNFSDLWASIVNSVIPSIDMMLKYFMDHNISNPMISLIGFQYVTYDNSNSNLNLSTNSRIGIGYIPYVSYTATNGINGYLYPPKSKFSALVYIAVTSAIVLGVCLATKMVAKKVKTRIRYTAWKKRTKLSELSQQATISGSYDDYIQLERAARRYNNFWGRFSGTSFDINNGWCDRLSTSSPISANTTPVLTALADQQNSNVNVSQSLTNIADSLNINHDSLLVAIKAQQSDISTLKQEVVKIISAIDGISKLIKG